MDYLAVWVHAFGSVLWAAARLVIFQQRAQSGERLKAIYGLAMTSAEQIDTAASAVREAARLGPQMLADYPVRRLRSAEAGLASVPLHELRSPMLLNLLVDLQQLVAEARQEIEAWRGGGAGRDLDDTLVQAFGATAADAAVIADDIRSWPRRRGGVQAGLGFGRMMMRVLLMMVALALPRAALADPCKAIPEKGPLPAYLAKGKVFSGPVPYVADGDGLCVDVGGRGDRNQWVEVRLGDYYAGELHDEGGFEARDALEHITRRGRVLCTSEGRKTWDRVVAVCRIGGVNLGERMRRAGMPEGGRGWRAKSDRLLSGRTR